MSEQELHATPELRFVKRKIRTDGLKSYEFEEILVLQQKYEIHSLTWVGDGMDGGNTWQSIEPSGEFVWKDVPTVEEE